MTKPIVIAYNIANRTPDASLQCVPAGGILYTREAYMVKNPTSYKEQVEILKSRNIIISDEEFCIDVLSQLNYYRLTSYMLPFKADSGVYSNITFEKVYGIYEFDRKLRSLLLGILEEIEILLRAKIAYYHAHQYGSLGYLNSSNYNTHHNHEVFSENFEKLIHKNKENLFVKHHINNKSGEFPIWVAVELFPFGMLSRFYADMHSKDKRLIATENFDIGSEQLESWLLCLSTLRNRCAHFMRLYYYNLNKWPKNTRSSDYQLRNTIFDYIYIMKYFYTSADKWRTHTTNIHALLDEHEEYIELRHIGFPENWEEYLSK